MKQVVVKVEKNQKGYKLTLNNDEYGKMILEIENHRKAIFEIFKDYNKSFDILERSLKFYPRYTIEMKKDYKSAVKRNYIMDCILQYLITEIGDVYVNRDFSKYIMVDFDRVVII